MDTFLKTCVSVLICFGTICLTSIVVGEKKYGCVIPDEPLYGSFVYNDGKKSLTLVCNNGFYMTGTRENAERRCIKGKWSGVEADCIMLPTRSQQCSRLNNPRNGKVILEGRNVGDKAHFMCESGFLLEGSEKMTCQSGYLWSGILPICTSRRTVEDLARDLENKLINKLAASTSDSKSDVQSKLSVGKSGLDIVFAVDTSSSIGPNSLKNAKEFIKIIVNIFGVSNETTGGKDGTRVALIQFSTNASIVFNLDDGNVRSVEKANETIETLQSSGGGTNFRAALDKIVVNVYEMVIKNKRQSANRAIFLITDAEQTTGKKDEEFQNIKYRATYLKNLAFEIFTIGVGKNIDTFVLSEIASNPAAEHVFLIKNFKDLERIAGIISEAKIDYGQCGISGNTDINKETQHAREGAWPWLGWIGVDDNSSWTCGGALLCDRWFVTLASCVSTNNSAGHIVLPSPDKISVYLADHNVYKKDNAEIIAGVQEILLHENYTGEKLKHGVRLYDIALLDLGENNTERPTLNKHIRPLCFPLNDSSSTYMASLTMLRAHQAFPDNNYGYTAGWGHDPENHHKRHQLWPELKQNKREVRKEEECKKRYRGLDIKKFFCVGNVFQEPEQCRGDIGGPYMTELNSRKFIMLGLAVKTEGCETLHEANYGIFLNVMDPLIVQWVESILHGCNRIKEMSEELIP